MSARAWWCRPFWSRSGRSWSPRCPPFYARGRTGRLACRDRDRRARGRADDIHQASQLAPGRRSWLPRVRHCRPLGDSEGDWARSQRRGGDPRLLDRLRRQLTPDPRRDWGARRRAHRRARALRRLARARRSRGHRLPRHRVLGPRTGRPARIPAPAPPAAAHRCPHTHTL